MTYTKRLVRGSAFLFVMSLLAGFLGYFTRIVLARNLTPTEYGLFYSIFAFVSFFLFFRDLGLNQALSKYISEFKAQKKYAQIKTAINSAFSWELISSLVFGILLFVFSDYLGTNYFRTASASFILKIFSIYIFFSMLVLLQQSILQGYQRMWLFSISEPLRNIIMFIFVFLFLNLGFKSLSPVYAFVISWVLVFLILSPFAKVISFNAKIKDFGKTSRLLFSFGLPVMLTAIGGKIIGRIDTMMLTYFTTLDKVGIYNVVLPTAMVFFYFSDSISAVIFPMISELWAKRDIKKLQDWLKFVYKYSFVCIVPIFLALLVFSELFIRVFFGEAYVSGTLSLQILLIGVLFFLIARLNNNTLAAIGKPMVVTKQLFYAVIVNVIANLLLIPKFGMVGAAISTVLSYILIFVLSTGSLSKIVKIKIPLTIWIKTFIASMIFVIAIYAVKGALVMNKWAELFISVPAAIVIYLIFIYLFRLVDVEEIRYYLALIK